LRYGLYAPNFGKASDPRTMAKMAADAEKSGWDGFFLWDHIVEWKNKVLLHDSFTTLAAIAVRTSRIRIGTTLTPLPRLKPWLAARETVSLDHLSNGRFTLGVGLGAQESCDYERFGEDPDNKVLASKLDESLEIITGLWTGKPFSYRGKHYQVGPTQFLPSPKQTPRIPIWVGGFWPRKAPFGRAARWDGVIPLRAPGRLLDPETLQQIVAYIKKQRRNTGTFEVANIGWTTGTNRKGNAEKVAKYQDAGATWWLESLWTQRDSQEKMRKRIRLGPPVAKR